MCEQSLECLESGLTMKRENRNSNKHECGEVKCKSCHQYYLDEDQHLCYVRAFASEIKPEKFIFYDFECTQENGIHVPNFVVAHSVCSQCEKIYH